MKNIHYTNFCAVISKGPATPLLETVLMVQNLSDGQADPEKTKVYWEQWQELKQAMKDNHPMVKLAAALAPVDPPVPPPRKQIIVAGNTIDLLTHDELVRKFPHLYADDGTPKDTPTHIHGRVVDALLTVPPTSKHHIDVVIQESTDCANGPVPEVYLTGSIKWDGCSNWNPSEHFRCFHGCDRDHLLDLGEVMARAWDAAGRLMPESWDGPKSPTVTSDPSAN